MKIYLNKHLQAQILDKKSLVEDKYMSMGMHTLDWESQQKPNPITISIRSAS